MEVNNMSHRDFHIWKQYQVWKVLYEFSLYGKCAGVISPKTIPHFLQKSIFPMAAALCQAHPAFIQITVKNRYFSDSNRFYEKYIVTQDYCVSTHNVLCSLKNCKFHLGLVRTSFSQILQGLDKHIYVYQELDCLYTLFKHRFHSSIVTSSGEVLNQLNRAVQHVLQWKGAKKMPSIAKQRLIRKNYERHYLSSNQKLASTQTHGSAFLDRIRKKIQNLNLIC